VDLSSVHGCLRELEDCSKGLAYFDHLWGRVIDDLDKHRETVETYESEAARDVREGLPAKGATAAEVNAGINHWFQVRPDARKARDELREAERRKAKLERWFRTLEKRMSAAQTAQNGHDQLARHGGS
jgi:hypothetical protein